MKKKAKLSGVLNIIRIVRSIIFGVILALLVGIICVTMIARISGQTPVLFGYSIYRVSSGSMAPELEVGDVILTRECDPMTLKEGDIVTYLGHSGTFDGKMVTHRVVKAPFKKDGKYFIQTKGDSNPVKDPDVSVKDVENIFLLKIDLLKNIYNIFITPWGLLIVIGLIILAFFNEIVLFVKALFGIGYNEKEESVEEIIERYQRENTEKSTPPQEDKED